MHFIVLASPVASSSDGMQWEAQHWFSKQRSGEVLIIATDGQFKTWQDL